MNKKMLYLLIPLLLILIDYFFLTAGAIGICIIFGTITIYLSYYIASKLTHLNKLFILLITIVDTIIIYGLLWWYGALLYTPLLKIIPKDIEPLNILFLGPVIFLFTFVIAIYLSYKIKKANL